MLRPTVSRPACLGTKHPFGDYDQIFITCVKVTVLFFWGALSDERSGMSFVCAAGPCQRSLSRVRVPWDLRPYFTVSDLRLPFRRLLRLTGSRWRYSTPPPHGGLSELIVLILQIEPSTQQDANNKINLYLEVLVLNISRYIKCS
jgi:hypothetical protein